MWWLLLLAANEVGTRDVGAASQPIDLVTGSSPRLIDARYDLRAARADNASFRLGAIDDVAVPARNGRPLAITAVDDERQRLVIGVKPGTGKNKLGVAYRLRFRR